MTDIRIPVGKSLDGGWVYLTSTELATHIEVVGLSGSGKSFFIEHLSKCFIKSRIGFFTITPHREYYDHMINWLVTTGYKRKTHLLSLSGRVKTLAFQAKTSVGLRPCVKVSSHDRLPTWRTHGLSHPPASGLGHKIPKARDDR